ncbi:hypothetical protein LINGRAPRIM_LOCUS2046 [Linum grandiflorum]
MFVPFQIFLLFPNIFVFFISFLLGFCFPDLLASI